MKKRLSDLEVSWEELARDEEEERRLSTRRFLTRRRIVAEHARLRASGDLVEKAFLAVAHDQHDILGPEHCDNIGRAWAEDMREWGPIEWGITTDRLSPPAAWR